MDGKPSSRLLHRPRLPLPSRTSGVWPVGLLVVLFFAALPLFVALSRGRPSLSDVWLMGVTVITTRETDLEPSTAIRDKLLGGLLSPDIGESSCLSRYQSSLHRKPSPHSPSPYLVSRLRKYEALHRKCGPGTIFYKKSLMQLTSAYSMGLVECSYLVWTPCGSSNLGDRMLSMASAFLYALLTRRVLVVYVTDDMAGLFCEPFPGASWELPAGFLVHNLTQLCRASEHSYANLLKAKKVRTDDPAGVRSESLPSYAYMHLEHDYQQPDQLFFCDDDQTVLAKVNWLILRSDLYFAPGLFLVPQFEDELRWMFPARDTVFHHISRYLFHPSNKVWDLITRYYTSYMAEFEEKIGIQLTTNASSQVSPEYFKQIVACTSQEKILPEIDPNPASSAHEAALAIMASKAVLVSSAQLEYAEKLKTMYYEHTTVTGESVSVLQPGSGGKHTHHEKALAEMFLQSYCDMSVISGRSTVGYIGHGLAGVKPWLLLMPTNKTAADPSCVQTTSMEPCYHAPPSYDCRAKKNGDLGAILRHVRHCEDLTDGLKLYD
ncbi:hypothetical protein GUJ93_ZPchr0009g1692 [Zizania palustris]|uniref:Fucosyltransferase n=1 Tax=Zizania palustris TaxID=103762 RepID=A0A8J5VK29_ZIZPA|nr:hypothetical protein GUJ93_ZPchr0009g1692 [Zizania palustris]